MKPKNRHNLDTFPPQWKAAPWAMAHSDAACCPRPGYETALKELFSGWLTYADVHAHVYGCSLGDEGVLGDHWAHLGEALRGLLNGSVGRFDEGLLDALIDETLRNEEFKT